MDVGLFIHSFIKSVITGVCPVFMGPPCGTVCYMFCNNIRRLIGSWSNFWGGVCVIRHSSCIILLFWRRLLVVGLTYLLTVKFGYIKYFMRVKSPPSEAGMQDGHTIPVTTRIWARSEVIQRLFMRKSCQPVVGRSRLISAPTCNECYSLEQNIEFRRISVKFIPFPFCYMKCCFPF